MTAAASVAGSGARLRQRAEQLAAPLPPLLVAAERVAATVAQGVHGRRRVGSGETFWQFRRYQFGDPATAIDWRQSAKSQRLFVRETEWEAAESVWLWRDASPSMRYRSRTAMVEKIERASVLALALAVLLARAGEYVALLGRAGAPSTGRAALARMTMALDPAAPSSSEPNLPPFDRLPRDAQVVLIGDFLSPLGETVAHVKRIAAAGISGHLLQVLDPAEEDLPFAGRARIEGLEDEAALTLGRVENLRDAYVARIAARRTTLAALCSRLGWTFAGHRTDRPPARALMALYAGLSGHERRQGLGVR